MANQNSNLKSFLGPYWSSFRKWFYPAWLIYETSYRFYGYSLGVHEYLSVSQDSISVYIGAFGADALSLFCSVSTFLICTLFLTVPACVLLFQLFVHRNLTGLQIEERIKFYF